ncbi:MAG: helix-turn-helix domain-containing protein [Symploca sp. SIO2G7]|nr:helix-turn-helix domain-containing protein [Symploca sp. SIO2G7]
MQSLEAEQRPKPEESLGQYVQRQRQRLGLTQKDVATQAGIHPQSLGKLERGKTNQLNRKTCQGLAYALQVPADYLDAISKGIPLETTQSLNICPHCWTPGTLPDPMWLSIRSKFCFACGTQLRHQCVNCDQPITSVKHRFCPYCGTPYKVKKPS